jgi:hypothetical protein
MSHDECSVMKKIKNNNTTRWTRLLDSCLGWRSVAWHSLLASVQHPRARTFHAHDAMRATAVRSRNHHRGIADNQIQTPP